MKIEINEKAKKNLIIISTILVIIAIIVIIALYISNQYVRTYIDRNILRKEVLEKMAEICKDVFEDESLIITEELSAADVEDWDSLAHMSLVNELGKTFGVTFTLEEVAECTRIGDLLDALMKHLSLTQ